MSKDEGSSYIQDDSQYSFSTLPNPPTSHDSHADDITDSHPYTSAAAPPQPVLEEEELSEVSSENTAAPGADLDSDNSHSTVAPSAAHNNSNNNTSSFKTQFAAITPFKKSLKFIKSSIVSRSQANASAGKSMNRYIQRQYDHVIRMLITVTVVFSVCQIPDMVQQLLSRISDWEHAEEFGIIAYDFIIINSSINLFIYTATSKRFKKRLFRTFSCLRRKGRQVGPSSRPSSSDNT